MVDCDDFNSFDKSRVLWFYTNAFSASSSKFDERPKDVSPESNFADEFYTGWSFVTTWPYTWHIFDISP